MEQQLNYTEQDIEVLEGLEPVRVRPAMYIGNTGLRGLHHLCYEILDNGIDEVLAGYCTEIYISIENGQVITVKDNGRGIPTGIHPKTGKNTVETIMTVLHAGGKFSGKGYKVSGGLHGVGASVVNALSEHLEVTVYRDGNIYQQHFALGKPLDELTIIGETNQTGTTIKFKPDNTIFEDINFNYNTLANRIRELAFLNKGVKITFEDKRKNKEQINVFQYDGGISEFVRYINKNKTVIHKDVLYIDKKIDDYNVEFSLQYTDDYNETMYGFANNIHTVEGGIHVNAFRLALLKTLNGFARKNDLLKEKDANFIADDVKEGLTAIISVKLENPEYEGQTKTKLGNTEFKPIIEKVVSDFLESYFIEHPQTVEVILKKALSAKKAREASKKAKELERKKSKLGDTNLKGKLADCSSKNPTECNVYIVEGDSAGGSAKQARNRKFDAVLPLRGKIMNIEKQRLDKILASEQIRVLINALGTGIGDEFDLSKLRYHKIIIMTDADTDGGHIRTLLLTFFYRYMKSLIENGHVYVALPPLYKNEIKKVDYYTYSEEEQIKFLAEHQGEKVDIQRYKGLGEMDASQLWETTMNPSNRKLIQLDINNDYSTDNTFSLLMGEVVEPRREFIIENAKLANVDI